MEVKLGAFWASAEKLKLVIQPFVAGFFTDLVFKVMDGAGGFDRFDCSAAGADQIIAVFPRLEEGEIGGALVEAEPAEDSVLGEALEETVYRGLVALIGETRGCGKLGEGHWSVGLDQGCQQFFQCLGAAQA